MSEEPDARRLEALEERLRRARAASRGAEPDAPLAVSQAQMAWRMIVELVVGIGIGVAIGYGLDALLGTAPWLLVVFTLFGFAAGVNVMLGSAREMNRAAGMGRTIEPAGGVEDEGGGRRDGEEAGTAKRRKGTRRERRS